MSPTYAASWKKFIASGRSGVIEPDALPAECRATTRANLSKLQSLERDAIVEALAPRATRLPPLRALGMSRARSTARSAGSASPIEPRLSCQYQIETSPSPVLRDTPAPETFTRVPARVTNRRDR